MHEVGLQSGGPMSAVLRDRDGAESSAVHGRCSMILDAWDLDVASLLGGSLRSNRPAVKADAPTGGSDPLTGDPASRDSLRGELPYCRRATQVAACSLHGGAGRSMAWTEQAVCGRDAALAINK
jgi:hypothetical protein